MQWYLFAAIFLILLFDCHILLSRVIFHFHEAVFHSFTSMWRCLERSLEIALTFFFPCSICKLRIIIYLFIFNWRLEAVSQSFCDHECQKRVFRYYTVTEWLSLEWPSGSQLVQLPCSSMQMTEKLSFHFVCPGSWGR